MPRPLATTPAASWVRLPTANVSSFAYHQGGAAFASRRLRHVRINPAQVDRALLSARKPLQFSSCCVGFTQLAVAFVADASSFIQRIGRQTSARFPSQLPGANPIASHNALPNQQIVNASADRLHHQVLSSSTVSVGIDPNEIGLTHAQRLFAPGAKAHD